MLQVWLCVKEPDSRLEVGSEAHHHHPPSCKSSVSDELDVDEDDVTKVKVTDSSSRRVLNARQLLSTSATISFTLVMKTNAYGYSSAEGWCSLVWAPVFA